MLWEIAENLLEYAFISQQDVLPGKQWQQLGCISMNWCNKMQMWNITLRGFTHSSNLNAYFY